MLQKTNLQADYKARMMRLGSHYANRIREEVCSAVNYDGQHEELLTRLQSEYVSELDIEKAKSVVSVGSSKVNKLFRWMWDVKAGRSDAALRLPAIGELPETRWQIRDANTIYVTERVWRHPSDTNAAIVPPKTLFKVTANGEIHGASERVLPTAQMILDELAKDHETYLRKLGREHNACTCCRKKLVGSVHDYSAGGLHSQCETIFHFEVTPHKNTFTNKSAFAHKKKENNRTNSNKRNKALAEAEKVFKKA